MTRPAPVVWEESSIFKMQTQSVHADQVERKWHVVDATDQPLGRLSSKIARILCGKHRATTNATVRSKSYSKR